MPTRPLLDWNGRAAVVIASGPSAAYAPLGLAQKQARVIAVNTSWRLAPWADVLFAGDYDWWSRASGWRGFKGRKATSCKRAADEFALSYIKAMQPDERLYLSGDSIGWGSSGFQAFNLALLCGAKRIALVGFDMADCTHWHGAHEGGMKNPTRNLLPRWRAAMDRAAKALPDDVEVTNCSAVSALQGFPKMSLRRWLSRS